MLDNPKMFVYLNASYFGSNSFGAAHFYGKLETDGCKDVRLTHTLSKTEAEKLNRKDNANSYSCGDETERFDSLESVIAAAQQTFSICYPNYAILILGESYIGEPQKILSAPRMPVPLIGELNALYNDCEELGWWDKGHYNTVQRISNKWFETINSFTGSIISEQAEIPDAS